MHLSLELSSHRLSGKGFSKFQSFQRITDINFFMLYFNISVAVALEVGLKTTLLKPTSFNTTSFNYYIVQQYTGSGCGGVYFFAAAACIVLCFGFVTKTVLTVHQCISYC